MSNYKTYPNQPIALMEAINNRGIIIEQENGWPPVQLDFKTSKEYCKFDDYTYMPDHVNAIGHSFLHKEATQMTRAEWLKTWHDYRIYLRQGYESYPDNPMVNFSKIPQA